MSKNKKETKNKVPFNVLRKGALTAMIGLTVLGGATMMTGCATNGTNGQDGTIWKSGTSYTEFTDAKVGDFFIDTDDYILYQKTTDSWSVVMENYGRPGSDGITANNIEMQVASGQIQWRYKTGTDTEWKNLLAVSTITGANGYTPYIQDGCWYINGENKGPAVGDAGREVEIEVIDDVISWKYVDESETEWKDIATLTSLAGQDGKNIELQQSGEWIQWSIAGTNNWQNLYKVPTDGSDGREVVIEVVEGAISWKYAGESSWKEIVKTGELLGKNIKLREHEGKVQWAVEGTEDWQDLYDVPQDAREIEIQKGENAIQWRYKGDSEWVDLVDLSLLKGKDGSNGTNGTNGTDGKSVKIAVNGGNIQWRYTDDSNEWQTIISTETLKGADGTNGTNGTTPHIGESGNWFIGTQDTGYKAAGVNGKEIKLQATADHIQWQYEGDAEWTNLIPLSSLKGADGSDGATWISGDVAPTTEGKDGDFYLNESTYDIYKKTDGTWSKIGNIKGQDGQNGSNGTNGQDGVVLNNASFMHVSFDDVEKCFTNLKNNSYDSLYDEPFFNWLKSMHDTYGAKFSLYAYNNVLTNVPNTYADEFLQAKDWLKIGLHAATSSSNFGSSSYEQGKSAWNTFVNNIARITGSYLSVDRMPRLHTFAGSEEALKGMRDANYGAIGFLSADDARNSYYFDQDTTDYLYYNDHITDHKNGLIFVATDLRADWFEGTSASDEYREPTKTSVYDELVERYTNVEYANSVSSYIFFGHEWLIYDGTTLDPGKQYFEDACKFAQDYDIGFDFSQNKAFNPTARDIYLESTTTGGEDDQEPEVTTVMYHDTEMQIVDSISEMTFDPNYAPSGGALSDFKPATVDGRATCITAVLAVNGGETIDFASNLEEIFGSTNLSFAVLEFSEAPLSESTLSDSSNKDSSAKTWLTEAHTLQINTRYVIIAFKNGDGTVDFTTEQLQALPQCLTLS